MQQRNNPLILSIETSTSACSVALYEGEKLLANFDLYAEQSHSAMLTTLCEQTVLSAGFQLNDLAGIAVGKGPGSYTGLRIGTATAKGLCYVLDIPLLAVNTLEAMAWQVKQMLTDEAWLCPMLDARRMEVYCAVYQADLQLVEPTQAKIMDATSFADLLAVQRIIFFGNGAAKCRKLLEYSPHAYFLADIHPSAKAVGALAHHLFQAQKSEDLAYFEPFYLKDFVSNTQVMR
jgi:tRNA threonylcarbamoyladenosine biosynthesis protein TsaB